MHKTINLKKPKVTLIGYKGFVGQHLLKNIDFFEFNLLSKSDFFDNLHEEKIKDLLVNSDLIILLSFINTNTQFTKMEENIKLCLKIKSFILKLNSKLLFISSDAADHGKTPYGKSKIECEDIFRNLDQYWYLRPGPIYLEKGMQFKGILSYVIQNPLKILPLPFAGKFNIKMTSIEEIGSYLKLIINNQIPPGEINLESKSLYEFIKKNFPQTRIINIPMFIIKIILKMPSIVKYRFPLDLIYTSIDYKQKIK